MIIVPADVIKSQSRAHTHTNTHTGNWKWTHTSHATATPNGLRTGDREFECMSKWPSLPFLHFCSDLMMIANRENNEPRHKQ